MAPGACPGGRFCVPGGASSANARAPEAFGRDPRGLRWHSLAVKPGALLLALPFAPQDAPFVPRVAQHSDEGLQAIQRFVPAAGIEVSLFAAEPRLANPVAFHVDHGGTVFVAETFRLHQGVTDIRQHMDWLDDDLAARTVDDRLAMFRKFEGANYDPGYGRAFEQVRRLVDRDGDFAADEDTVFATGFADHAAGIGAGVLSYRGDVFYTCIPDLWRLRDADGDGQAEQRDRLSSGYGVHVALLGHDLHGLCVGPDRRLYFSCGDRGFQVETEDGVIAHPQCGAVLRCELDGSRLEVWHTGLRNPQELAFDDFGNLWTGDNNSDGGDRARWVRVVEGGDSGWRYAYQWITEPVARGPWNDEQLWHPAHAGQAAYIVPPVANLADGPSGLACYPGTGLSSAYAGHFFLCDFRGDASTSGVHTFTVTPKGASFELGPVTRFLWGSLVTDCDFGPDGALWFSDWVYGWELTGKGRLYRAVDPEAQRSALVAETRALLGSGMGARAPDELVELLGHPDRRVRQEAHFELAERGAVDELASVAVEGPSLLARLHAIWGLGIAGRRTPKALDTLIRLLNDPEAEVRAQSLRVLGDERHPFADSRAVSRLADDDARVRFFAALAVGRLKSLGASAKLAELLRATGENDPDLRHAAVMGLVGCADFAALDVLARDPSPHVRMGVLLALRRLRDRTVARFLLDDEPRLVLEAARAIHDVPIEGGLESLARTRVDEARVGALRDAFVRRVLNANYRLGRAETLASFAEDPLLTFAQRVEALDMLAHWECPPARDRVTNEWRPIEPRSAEGLAALAERLASGRLPYDADVVAEAFVRFVGASRVRAVAPRLAELVTQRGRAAGVKAAALAALEAMAAEELMSAVLGALGDGDGRVRAAAFERLARLAPAEVLATLPGILAQGEIAERRAAYRYLGASREPSSAELLLAELAKLEAELLPAELVLDLVLACERNGSAGLQEHLARRAAGRTNDAVLAPWLDTLLGGDRAAGEHVFQRVDLSCTRCHAWWGHAAERVGPNLFGVGQRLTRLQILESILAPNRFTTPGFGARAFFLADGRVVSGRVFEESDTLVRLFDAENKPVALPREEIVEERADVSAMPEDLAKGLRPSEMRDLIEYLSGL